MESTMADTVTPNKVELARPVDADALQAWYDKHGITPRADGTFDTLPYGESPVGDETILDQVRVNAVRHDIPNLRGAILQDATMVYVGGGAERQAQAIPLLEDGPGDSNPARDRVKPGLSGSCLEEVQERPRSDRCHCCDGMAAA